MASSSSSSSHGHANVPINDHCPRTEANSPVPGRLRGKRGPSRTSCAECRRCKLKCDGLVPCQQCVKRGCESTCPEQEAGSHRRVLFDTGAEHQARLVVYKDRIRDLEDALRSAHSVISHEPHPLLSEDLLHIKNSGKLPKRANAEDGLLERFGSLSLSHDGKSKFFGHAANGWMLTDNNENELDDSYTPSTFSLGDSFPADILPHIGIAFPSSLRSGLATPPEDELCQLFDLLPSQDQITQLTSIVFEYGLASFQPIQFDDYHTRIFEPLYQQPIHFDDPLLSVRLAMMYALLAHAAQSGNRVDRPSAEKFLHLSGVALTHSKLIDIPTIEGIQALFMISIYLGYSDTASRCTSTRRSALAGLLMRLCQIIGLHSDPCRYNFSPQEVKRRRLLFAEIYVNDMNHGMWTSRPSAITTDFIDVQPHLDDEMSFETNYHIWKYKFALECLSIVQVRAFAISPPSHSTVLALSQQVENYPAFMHANTELNRKKHDYTLRVMQMELSRGHKEDVLLHMHRPFCLIATEKYRNDPLGSEYGKSVAAVYRSANRILQYGHSLLQAVDHPINRAWSVWARSYDAAIMLGTIVIRCPHLSFSADAYGQLCSFYTRVYNVREAMEADRACDKLGRTLHLAHQSLFAHINNLPLPRPFDDHEAEMLLAKLGVKAQITFKSDTRLRKRYAGSTGLSTQHVRREEVVVPIQFHLDPAPAYVSADETFGAAHTIIDGSPNHFTLSPLVTEWGLPSNQNFNPTGLVRSLKWEEHLSDPSISRTDQSHPTSTRALTVHHAPAILGFPRRNTASSPDQTLFMGDGFAPFI